MGNSVHVPREKPTVVLGVWRVDLYVCLTAVCFAHLTERGLGSFCDCSQRVYCRLTIY